MWQENAEVRWQAVQIARLAATTRAYAAEWDIAADSITSDTWESLPLLSKEQLISAVAEDPFGGRLTVQPADLAWVFAAPGPIYMPYTADDMKRVTAAYARALGSCGLDSADIVDQTLLYNWVIAATMVDQGLRTLGCAVVPGGPGATDQHAEVIARVGVTGVIAMPSFLEHLLKTIGDRPHSLRKAVIMGELSDAGAKQRIADTYGVTVREFYGVGDVGAVAYECERGDGMHLRPDLLIEFVNPETGEVSSPTKGSPSEIVVTDFAREAMPIVRLRSGDLVDEIIYDECGCGNSAPRIPRIIGRANDITKVRGMFIVPSLVTRTLTTMGIDSEHCVVVDRHEGRDEIEVLISGTPQADIASVSAALERALRIRTAVRFVDALPPGDGVLRDQRHFEHH
ncbi:phenylacetate--CoA ligase family protein [Rhodococcus oxybenzonivorans]|uniref:phenylacetate--CoA ligase family protein n=1 Tax=Rhodococcus oxybenzonivorans TaxID=1990687 RepID=UPI002953CFFD|nr:phenylacetate--CoA ligase family protein [Rhodococcus oxybenzonivorans]MDV7355281.1 phenylacetate--CoA ligase family protein [Rhodococcus oxybenzonivorans]